MAHDNNSPPQRGLVSYRDHCAAVAECKRLLDDLKHKYDTSRATMFVDLNRHKEELEKASHDRHTWELRYRAQMDQLRLKERHLQDVKCERRELLQSLEELLRYAEKLRRARSEDRLRASSRPNKHVDKEKETIRKRQHGPHQQERRRTIKRERIARLHMCYTFRIRALKLRIVSQRRVIDQLNCKNRLLRIRLNQVSQSSKAHKSLPTHCPEDSDTLNCLLARISRI